jgi:hypothetical protein
MRTLFFLSGALVALSVAVSSFASDTNPAARFQLSGSGTLMPDAVVQNSGKQR